MPGTPRRTRALPALIALIFALGSGVLALTAPAVAVPAAPTAVTAPPTGAAAFAISAGYIHTCAIRTGGSLECWGDNTYGQAQPPSGAFTAVSSGSTFSCALQNDGDASDGAPISCWGEFANGDPVVGPTGDHFIQVDVTFTQACARDEDWYVTCWGATPTPTPTTQFYDIAVGASFVCGIASGGALSCWGFDGPNHYVTGAPSGTFTTIDASNDFTCAVRQTTGEMECWGFDGNGQISNVPSGAFLDVGLTQFGACGITSPSRALSCWGQGQGITGVPSGAFLSVSGGFDHSCGMNGSTGRPQCWGRNDKSQSQPGLSAGTIYLHTGVAVTDVVPLTHVWPAPTISATGTLPAGVTRTGVQFGGAPTATGTSTLTITSSSIVMAFEQNLDLFVSYGPVTSYRLELSDTTPVEGQNVSFTLYSKDPVGNEMGDVTGSAVITSDVTGDAHDAYGSFTFAPFSASAGVTDPVVHTLTVGLTSGGATEDIPITVGPLIATIDLVVDPTTVAVRGIATATVSGRDASGTTVADLTAYSTITSTGAGDTVSGDEITVSGTPGSRTIGAVYGTLTDSVSLSATPGPLASIVVTPSASHVDEGDSVTLGVEGFDADGNTLGDLTSSAAFTSSVAGDHVTGATVDFDFDPAAAATTPVAHVLTATIGAVSDSATVTVDPLTDDIELTLSSLTATVGETVTVTVVARDASGDPLGDVSSAVVVTSDQPADIVSGATVLFTHASPHLITATYGTLSASTVVQVSPRPSGLLGNTGIEISLMLQLALALLAAGALALLVAIVRRASTQTPL